MRRSLFDRVFTYAASERVLPAENLATEITAYFLDQWPILRQRFLKEAGILDADESWTVETQQRLPCADKDWDRKIPDLMLRSDSTSALILVEVKVDAGTTYSGEAAQTALYREYLDAEFAAGRVRQATLALLTRWAPEAALAAPAHHCFRFTQFAAWLKDCIAQDPSNSLVALAEQWLSFLREKRWAMVEITPAHIQAIAAMGELLPQLWEVLAAAKESVRSQGTTWKAPPNGRSSSGTLFDGSVLWAAPIALATDTSAKAHVGFFYGTQEGDTSLYPLVWFNDKLVFRPPADLPVVVRPDGWGAYAACFPNLVPAIRSGRESQEIWDTAKTQLASVFQYFQPASAGGVDPGQPTSGPPQV